MTPAADATRCCRLHPDSGDEDSGDDTIQFNHTIPLATRPSVSKRQARDTVGNGSLNKPSHETPFAHLCPSLAEDVLKRRERRECQRLDGLGAAVCHNNMLLVSRGNRRNGYDKIVAYTNAQGGSKVAADRNTTADSIESQRRILRT